MSYCPTAGCFHFTFPSLRLENLLVFELKMEVTGGFLAPFTQYWPGPGVIKFVLSVNREEVIPKALDDQGLFFLERVVSIYA